MKRGPDKPETGAQTTWYVRGRTAFLEGCSMRQCPFPMRKFEGNSSRYWWMRGWYDANTGRRLARAFERLGIEWP